MRNKRRDRKRMEKEMSRKPSDEILKRIKQGNESFSQFLSEVEYYILAIKFEINALSRDIFLRKQPDL